ncbi:MAG: GNAT family N-acetyltransferase [Acidihalobacter sp.]
MSNTPLRIPYIHTPRTVITLQRPENIGLLLRYYIDNHAHLAPWDPLRPPDFHTPEAASRRAHAAWENFRQGNSVQLVALDTSETEVVGICNFANIVYGAFMACHMGYSIAHKHQGQGLMFEIADAAIAYIFSELDLHRVMANHIPENIRSRNLLARLGFETEGTAKSYLKIAGQWRDHILTSKLNPAH